MAGGIPLLNLGAMPALPSPAAGIPKVNPLVQLGQEAAKIPAEIQAQKQDANKTELQDQQIADLKRKTVQDRYDRNLQLVRNNPALKKSAPLLSAIAADAKTLGIVPPITDTSTVAGSSATAIPASSSAATPAGGAAPAGSAPPQQEGGMGAPLNMPAAPAPGDASAPAPAAGAPPSAAMPSGGPAIDMEAISPHPGFSSFATPQNIKEAYGLTPEQRQSAYPPSMFAPNDQPPLAFYQAPKTWGPDDTQKAMTARTIMQQTIKSGDPKSIAAAVDAISPMYKDDPNYDISKLIDPSVWTNMNQLQKERLDIMKRAGVISEKSLDLRSRKIDSDIQLAQTRQGLLQYTAQQKQIENTFLPQELQTRIQKMQSDMTNSTKNAATAAGTLQQKIAQNQITNLNADKAAALKARGQLNSSIIAMQNQARALVSAGQDQTPVTGDDGQPTTLGAQLASQIVAAQKQRDDLNAAVGIADNPQTQAAAIKQQLPNAKNVSTDPAKVNQIMAYYKQLTPAQRAQYINRPDMPADVRAKLQAMP